MCACKTIQRHMYVCVYISRIKQNKTELSHKSLNITNVKSPLGFVFMTQTKNLHVSISFRLFPPP